jgi:hypothetical protein
LRITMEINKWNYNIIFYGLKMMKNG